MTIDELHDQVKDLRKRVAQCEQREEALLRVLGAQNETLGKLTALLKQQPSDPVADFLRKITP